MSNSNPEPKLTLESCLSLVERFPWLPMGLFAGTPMMPNQPQIKAHVPRKGDFITLEDGTVLPDPEPPKRNKHGRIIPSPDLEIPAQAGAELPNRDSDSPSYFNSPTPARQLNAVG